MDITSSDAPWNESHMEMVLNFPVAARANLRAIPIATVPPGAKRTRFKSPGASSTSFLASLIAGILVYRRVQNESSSIWALMASITWRLPKPTWWTLFP